MKGKELKSNEKTIELSDGKHKIAINFNAFEELEEIYGDMETAFSKFSGKVKFKAVKSFLCAAVNACIENEEERYTPHKIGELLIIDKLTDYVTVLGELITLAMPAAKEIDEDEEEVEEGKN